MLVQRLIALSLVACGVAACSAASDPTKGNFGSGTGGTGAGGAPAGAAASTGAGAGTGVGTGSTGPGVPVTNNAGGAPIFGEIPEMDPNSMDCAGIINKGEQITVDIFIMFDQSLSMTCTIPSGGDRWDAVKTALQQFVMLPDAAGINVGIQYFGLGGFGLNSSCDAMDYQGADVEIGPLPMNAQPITDSLNAHMPATNTPTAPALIGAINHAIAWKNAHPGHTVVVVLVTDGQPNGCGTVQDVAANAAMGLMSTIPTYVIGVTSPGTTCLIDMNPPNQQDLDTVAMAGGTTSALLVDTTMDTAQQFVATMNKIRATSQVPCQYAIPKATSGTMVDPTKVNVEFTPPGAGMPITILNVPSAAACDPNTGGWFYDNNNAPTKINLCQNTCAAATMMTGGAINIRVGCITKKPA